MNKNFSMKKNNKGSALVNVTIVVAFMSILATISLAIAGTNFKMKVADYSTKASFYDSEEVVEIFRSQLILDTQEAAEAAYKITGSQFCEKGNITGREELYLSFFKNEFKKVWDKHWSKSGAVDYETGILNLFPGSYIAAGDGYNAANNSFKFHIIIAGEDFTCVINEVDDLFKYNNALDSEAMVGHYYMYDSVKNDYIKDASGNRTIAPYYIKKLDIFVTNYNGYSSRIVTSFIITPPSFNWNDNKSLKDSNGNDIVKMSYSDTVLYYEWAKE